MTPAAPAFPRRNPSPQTGPVRLSVIIPAYNSAATLAALLDSLVGQAAEHDEIIVVDDASTDDTPTRVAGFPSVRSVCHDINRGAGAARNRGARAAGAPLLLFLDADTVADPGLLARVATFFETHPAVDAASGAYLERNPERHAFARYLDASEAAMRAADDGPAPGSLAGCVCAIRREAFLAVGGFSEDRRQALEDIELGLRLARAGYIHWLCNDWRVGHRQPRLLPYLREILPRTRDYCRLLRHFGAFNEIMGGAGEGLARLASVGAGVALGWLLAWPGTLSVALATGFCGLAAWTNRSLFHRLLQVESPAFFPIAMFFHFLGSATICAGAGLGVADALLWRWRRTRGDFAVVGAWLRSLLTPGASGYLIHFVTHRCNARCEHCFDHPQRAAIDKTAELDVDRIRRLAASAGALGHVSLTGGEPLLRDDLDRIFSAWYAAGVRSFSLSTNGGYPEKLAALIPQILAAAPRARLIVSLSVDALAARHDALRGLPGLFADVLRSLSMLDSLRSLTPQLRIHACLTLTAANAADAAATIEWLRRWALDEIELNALRGRPALAELGAASDAAYDDLRRRVGAANGGSRGLARVFAALDRRMFGIVRRWREPWPCGPCLAGKRLQVILADGTVLPCEMLRTMRPRDSTAFAGFALGRLDEFDDDLAALRAGPQARKVIDYIAASECRCSFECAIFATLAYRPWRLPRLLAPEPKAQPPAVPDRLR